MFTSPVPIYLGCAGLIVGSLGLGAQHLMSRGSAPVPTSAQEQPLFAKSVEEAALPATHWPSQNPEVAFYEPMVELLTTPARISEPSQPTATRQEEPTVAARREVVRDVPHEQVKQSSRRAKITGQETSPRRTSNPIKRFESAAGSARKSRTTLKRGTPNRAVSGAAIRIGEESEPVEMRSRSERGGQRVVIREGTREPERFARERQESPGFSPFRLFGIFDQR